MRLILNVFRNGECVRIIAIKEEKEEGFTCFGYQFSTGIVELRHNAAYEGIHPGSLPNNRDEDYFVEFTVTHSFKKFCEAFQASSYNDHKKYGQYTHNCADAARFALGLVDIELPLARFKFNRYNPGTYLRVPGVSTPYELFLAAKEYKIQLLEVQRPVTDSIYAQLERAKSSLQDVALPDAEVKKDVEIILAEVDKKMLESPHHAESYLRALLKLNEMFIQSIENAQQIQQECTESAAFFQKRLPSLMQGYLDQYAISLFALVLCMSYAGRQFEESYNSLSLLNRMLVGGSSAGLGVSFTVFFNRRNHRQLREDKDRAQIKVDTELSKAMFDLIEKHRRGGPQPRDDAASLRAT